MRKALVLALLIASTGASAKAPKLVLFISVDGMGTDVFLRMRPRLKTGLAQLTLNGAYFPQARYSFPKTSTAPGHATLATGTNPWRHGVVANRSLNPANGKLEPTLVDAAHPALEAPPAVEDVSPQRLKVETLADRLRLSTSGKGKAIALAGKARASIPLAGRLGQAWWYHEGIGKFVTGTSYLKEFPAWARAFNDKKLPDGYFGKEWALSRPAAEYSGEDDFASEADILGMGRTFPHAVTGGLPAAGKEFYSALLGTPFHNELLVALAKDALDGEQLGKDDATDLLAISFSALDRISHLYGPYSWEVQDALLRLDRSVADLIALAERAAGGKANLLVVLTADHGCAALPEYWAGMGMPAGRINPETLGRSLNAALKPKFGFDPVMAVEGDGVDVYLDRKLIADKKADAPAIRRAAAQWLREQPQIDFAVAADDLYGNATGTGQLALLQRGFHPEGSGDVLFLAKPFVVVDSMKDGTNHGSPHAYDSLVPVIFSGRGIKPGTYGQPIDPVDVAPTAAFLMEIGPPAQAEGQVRWEILANGKTNGK